MTLAGQYGITYNLKRIRRIMKKYAILCPIRKANPYKKMMKATQEHSVLPNLLKRNFKQNTPGKVLLTDITYLFYGQGKKAYLSTIKDSSTNEVMAYHVSDRLTLDVSRRGNCWDNAPQESFFGHFKDEAYIKTCDTLEQLKNEIKQYMIYYNNYRYQWGLKKMTPVQYRNHLLKIA
jgi:transposase InsO family protein